MLTVGICTWNRAAALRRTLESMERLEPIDGPWELIVVDNNSTDDTPAVLADFATRLPLRAMHEPRAGKSNAANLVLREARGTWLVWTDDDVIVAPRWLRAYAEAFEQWPSADIFGGPIRPLFEGTPAPWLARASSYMPGVYAERELGPEPRRLEHSHDFPYGANMAFRTSAQRSYTFDPRIGPRPGSELRGEEVELIGRMVADGRECRWVPDAAVQHVIPPHRQSLRFARAHEVGHGEYVAIMEPEAMVPRHDRSRRVGEIPLWLWRRAITAELRFRARFLLQRDAPERWVPAMCWASTHWGFIATTRRLARERARMPAPEQAGQSQPA